MDLTKSFGKVYSLENNEGLFDFIRFALSLSHY